MPNGNMYSPTNDVNGIDRNGAYSLHPVGDNHHGDQSVHGPDSINGIAVESGEHETNGRPRPPTVGSTIPIAIIGMACRFAGDATSPSKLWDLCSSGTDSWSKIPRERFNHEAWYDPASHKLGRVSDFGDRSWNERCY